MLFSILLRSSHRYFYVLHLPNFFGNIVAMDVYIYIYRTIIFEGNCAITAELPKISVTENFTGNSLSTITNDPLIKLRDEVSQYFNINISQIRAI
jgi:hypothetical protein